MNNNQFRKQEFEKRRVFKKATSLCNAYSCPIFQNCLLEIKQLQQENNQLKKMVNHKHKYCSEMEGKYILEREKNKKLHNKIDKLLKENESLRARIKTIKRLRKKQTQKKNKYKSIVTDFQKALEKKNNKIDKAIKYINFYDIALEDKCEYDYHLLEILKGDVDE